MYNDIGCIFNVALTKKEEPKRFLRGTVLENGPSLAECHHLFLHNHVKKQPKSASNGFVLLARKQCL